MYCSKSCKEQHSTLVHQFLCHLETENFTERTVLSIEDSIRMFMTGVQELGSFKEFYKLLKDPVKSTVFDFEDLSAKNFVSIVSSLTESKIRKNECSKILSGDVSSYIFERAPLNAFWSTKEELEDVKDCFLRIFAISATNSMTLGEHRLKNGRRWDLDTVGYRVCAFGSLFSHSCDPNIDRVTVDNKIVFFVIRPIKAGEQIFMSYGPEFSRQTLLERRLKLFGYGFNCDCNACHMDFPLLDELPNIRRGFFEPPFNTFDVGQSIYHLTKNCKFIDENHDNHPCFETEIMIHHNLHVLYQIAKLKL